MELIAGGVKKNEGERQPSLIPTPAAGAALRFLRLADSAPEEQGEQGVFRQVTDFAENVVDEFDACLRHLRKEPM